MRLRTVYVVVYDLNAQPRRKAVLAFYITLFWWLKKKKKSCSLLFSLFIVGSYLYLDISFATTDKKET